MYHDRKTQETGWQGRAESTDVGSENLPDYDDFHNPIVYGRRSLNGIWIQCEAGCFKHGEEAWHLYDDIGLQESKCWSWDSEHYQGHVVVEILPMVRSRRRGV